MKWVMKEAMKIAVKAVMSKPTLAIRGTVGFIAVVFSYSEHNQVLVLVRSRPSERLRCAAHPVSFRHAYSCFVVLCWWIAFMGS